jgi:DNA-binding CsgD family transcriptional regulator
MWKEYADYDYLYDEYVKNRKSVKEIAEENEVSEMTIWNHLNRHGLLKLRGKGRRLGSRKVIRRGHDALR